MKNYRDAKNKAKKKLSLYGEISPQTGNNDSISGKDLENSMTIFYMFRKVKK